MSTTGNGRPPRQLGGMHTTRQGRRSQRGGCLVSQAGRAGPGLALASTWSGTVWVRAPQDALRPTFLPRPQGGTPRRRPAPAGTGATGHGTQLCQWPLLTGLQCGRGSLPGPRTQLGRHPGCSHGNGHQANCPRTRAQAPWRRPPLVPPRSWPPPGSRAMASCKATARRPDCPARPGACLWASTARTGGGPCFPRASRDLGSVRAPVLVLPAPPGQSQATPPQATTGTGARLPSEFLLMAVLLQKCPPALPPGPLPPPSAEEKTPRALRTWPFSISAALGQLWPTCGTLSLADGTRQGPSTSLPS